MANRILAFVAFVSFLLVPVNGGAQAPLFANEPFNSPGRIASYNIPFGSSPIVSAAGTGQILNNVDTFPVGTLVAHDASSSPTVQALGAPRELVLFTEGDGEVDFEFTFRDHAGSRHRQTVKAIGAVEWASPSAVSTIETVTYTVVNDDNTQFTIGYRGYWLVNSYITSPDEIVFENVSSAGWKIPDNKGTVPQPGFYLFDTSMSPPIGQFYLVVRTTSSVVNTFRTTGTATRNFRVVEE